jgi:Xaa-Pro aminopeptidase
MRYKKAPKDFFSRNRSKLAKNLPEKSLVIVHSSDEMPRNGDQTYPFRQLSDLFYLTGLDQEKCILVMAPGHPDRKMREMVFTIKTNEKMVTWSGYRYTKEQAQEVSGISSVFWSEDFDAYLRALMVWAGHVFLHQNEYPKFTTEVPLKNERFIATLKAAYPLHRYYRLAPLLKRLRSQKAPEELEIMQHACNITNSAFRRVLSTLKPGMQEYEVEAEITYIFLKNGASGHAYAPVIASGKNACILHYIDNDQSCEDGELLLMDFGAEYGNYAADCSRTIPVNGRFTPRQRECYEAVLRVQKKAEKLFVPGNTINFVDKKVKKMMEKEMIGLGLFTEEDVKNQDENNPMFFKYFMHGMNHFIGLDVHDVGDKHMAFKDGMVLTCEPGLYIPAENIGIRIEDDIVVGKSPRNLMKDIPKEVAEIEQLMLKQ